MMMGMFGLGFMGMMSLIGSLFSMMMGPMFGIMASMFGIMATP
jgi:hypothetical protein